jgi:hypothetical protein
LALLGAPIKRVYKTSDSKISVLNAFWVQKNLHIPPRMLSNHFIEHHGRTCPKCLVNLIVHWIHDFLHWFPASKVQR